MIATLTRWGDTPWGTFGTLMLPGGFSCFTVERNWKNNAPNVSCIPAGTYRLARKVFNRGGYETYELTNVPTRTHILIHAANWSHELAGCIAPGRRCDMRRPKATESEPRPEPALCVVSSRITLNLLLNELWKQAENELKIRWRVPTGA